ncbi:MAG: flagellar hook assembly protein FlgD [Methylococcales bacterium]|nr:flagellar hook assembly protein FlgD [Methylococcales bacterium]
MSINSIETYRNLGLAPEAEKVESNKKELGQDEFLKLMTTQMTHQDPNKPMENGDFLAQMAQFSTVEGISSLNDSFTEFSSSISSGQGLQAATLVGQSVMVASDEGVLSVTKNLQGEVDLKGPTEQLNIEIMGSDGNVVKTLDLGKQEKGNVEFEWDGLLKDGIQATPGTYKIIAESVIDGNNTNSQTYFSAEVKSVSLGKEAEGITLDLAGLGKVKFNEVKKIF